ncbi:hypothetical protein BS17DRAFT_779015 [Gyrodon lividus]|nr:hypothetical protein BS17DRAFT_779015 [Gyrodon lividus]
MNKSCNMLSIRQTAALFGLKLKNPDEEGRGTDEPDGNGPIGDQTEYCSKRGFLCPSASSATPFPVCVNFTAWSQ